MDAYLASLNNTDVLVTLIVVAFIAYLIGKANGGPDRDGMQGEANRAQAVAGLTPQQKMDIDAAIDSNKKIEAIRIMRAATGMGLKQSKLAVDARIRERDLTDKA